MPVEERLRRALADRAAMVVLDPEGPLKELRRRRAQRLATLWAGVAAALVVTVVGVTAALAPEPERPAPLGPPPGEKSDPPVDLLPLGTYQRQVTSGQLLAAGFSGAEVRSLLGGHDRSLAVLTFRLPDGPAGENSWILRFVHQDGGRYGRDAGSWFVPDEGELTTVSRWKECLGCTSDYKWRLERSTLRMRATGETRSPEVAALLEHGAWRRRPR